MAELTPKEACDKIVNYLGKLSEKEFTRIGSEIKRIREVRRNVGVKKLDFGDGQEKNTTTDKV